MGIVATNGSDLSSDERLVMPVPRTMKAVLLRGHGCYEQLDYREDHPVPVVAAGEVLVQVLAAGVNNTDVNTRIGWYSKAVTGDTASAVQCQDHAASDGGWTGVAFVFPRIQGADACGPPRPFRPLPSPRVAAAGASPPSSARC